MTVLATQLTEQPDVPPAPGREPLLYAYPGDATHRAASATPRHALILNRITFFPYIFDNLNPEVQYFCIEHIARIESASRILQASPAKNHHRQAGKNTGKQLSEDGIDNLDLDVKNFTKSVYKTSIRRHRALVLLSQQGFSLQSMAKPLRRSANHRRAPA